MQANKTFTLTWVYCNKVTEVKTGDVKILQALKSKLKKEKQYKNGFFEIRTPEGLKAKPILKTTNK